MNINLGHGEKTKDMKIMFYLFCRAQVEQIQTSLAELLHSYLNHRLDIILYFKSWVIRFQSLIFLQLKSIERKISVLIFQYLFDVNARGKIIVLAISHFLFLKIIYFENSKYNLFDLKV